MFDLQTYASQGGFWVFMIVASVAMIGAAIYFRPEVDGGPPGRNPETLLKFVAVIVCVAIALGAWIALAHMIGSR